METVRRMRRAERRQQIIDAAARTFARTGFGATSLEAVAHEAGISKVILYRHFESKTDLYRAVLDRCRERLVEQVGDDHFDAGTIPALVRAAGADPDGFRVLFRYAAREPEFRDVVDSFTATSVELARRELAERIPDPAWAGWAARLAFTVTVEGVLAWLDTGSPDADPSGPASCADPSGPGPSGAGPLDPGVAAERITLAVRGVIGAAAKEL
ncbi:TetR/AcrR family transcriptional regulator [Nonomuraea roseoviolacea]|uniref:AcrR family transcriptional regulator n=1 Tax=Nonomuraea roseoviolacea subsp. carminata TaxID=160689 RepID=A0ABT1JS47_9ACTN|nr:TetR/AcrR family transcriptional regulator [Nonomuraea roseoviolacea]MCP2344565.1 AcrR family transcriptional regulator [Nonomuraea roseoviolacea subsp. carminata]